MTSAFKNVSPKLTLVFLGVFYAATLIGQYALPYFPSNFPLSRFPAGRFHPMVDYDLIKEFLQKQHGKPAVLIGDSAPYGYGVTAREALATRLSESGDTINLSAPGFGFPMESLLLEISRQLFPEKPLIVQLNPKWFSYSWFTPNTLALKTELSLILPTDSVAYQVYLNMDKPRFPAWQKSVDTLALNTLRTKIEYRWLNVSVIDRTNEWLEEKFKNKSPRKLARSYIRQEYIDRADAPKPQIKEKLDQNALDEVKTIMSADPEKSIAGDHARAFFDAIRRARPRVAVFIQPIDPEATAQMPSDVRKNYDALIRACEKQLAADGVPYETLRLTKDDYSDFNHFSATGHNKAMASIKNLLLRLNGEKK